MSRPSNALHTWRLAGRPEGDLRLLAPGAGKRSFRLVWREGGRQRERTTTDLDAAHTIGMAEAVRLTSAPGLPGPDASFGAALADHLDPAARGVRWSEKYQRRLARLVARWLDEDLLALPFRVLEPPHGRMVVAAVLERLEVAGYPRGTHEYEQMGALLSGTFRGGIEAGFFTANYQIGTSNITDWMVNPSHPSLRSVRPSSTTS